CSGSLTPLSRASKLHRYIASLSKAARIATTNITCSGPVPTQHLLYVPFQELTWSPSTPPESSRLPVTRSPRRESARYLRRWPPAPAPPPQPPSTRHGRPLPHRHCQSPSPAPRRPPRRSALRWPHRCPAPAPHPHRRKRRQNHPSDPASA